MSIQVNIQGEIVPPEQAKISVFDRQFLYGDGIYETLRTFGGRPFLVEGHLRRLRRSARGIGLSVPWTDEALILEMNRTLEAAGNSESSVRIILTRGEGEFGLDPTGIDEPSLVIIVRPLNPVDPRYAREGIDLVIPSVRRTSTQALASHIKSGNYLNQAMALAEGRKRGAYEVVMLDGAGNLTEGSTSNVFFVKNGTLYTPSVAAGVLPGLTRAIVLGLALQLGIPTERGLYPAEWLFTADEAFITASIKELLPVRRCDDRPIGSTVPGPITARLLEAYHAITHRAEEGTLKEEETEALLESGGGEDG